MLNECTLTHLPPGGTSRVACSPCSTDLFGFPLIQSTTAAATKGVNKIAEKGQTVCNATKCPVFYDVRALCPTQTHTSIIHPRTCHPRTCHPCTCHPRSFDRTTVLLTAYIIFVYARTAPGQVLAKTKIAGGTVPPPK